MTTNYVRIHDKSVIPEIESRGPVYQVFTSEIFPDYKSGERKRRKTRRKNRRQRQMEMRGNRRLDSRDRGEKVRLMKSIGPQCGFESLVPTI